MIQSINQSIIGNQKWESFKPLQPVQPLVGYMTAYWPKVGVVLALSTEVLEVDLVQMCLYGVSMVSIVALSTEN